MKNKILMASLVAIFVIVAAVPFVDNDGSDALTGNNGLSLDKNDAILYVSGGTNTTTFSVVTDPLPGPQGESVTCVTVVVETALVHPPGSHPRHPLPWPNRRYLHRRR